MYSESRKRRLNEYCTFYNTVQDSFVEAPRSRGGGNG